MVEAVTKLRSESVTWFNARSPEVENPQTHTDDHAGIKDFRNTFIENIDSLYLLSLLPTGDQEKAERCFVTGFEEPCPYQEVRLVPNRIPHDVGSVGLRFGSLR